jgi:hypothetical protein
MAAEMSRSPSQQAPELPEAEFLRRGVRVALMRARAAAGLTQKATAEALAWSVSKVVRIEQGTVPVSPSDVLVMLTVFGQSTPEEIDEVVQMARRARDAVSLDEYEDVMSAAYRDMVGQETKASSIWKYEPAVVPGYFQTSSYTTSLYDALGLTSERASRLAEVRSKRQAILDLPTCPEIHVVLGEIALARPVGGPDVMREQITHLKELSSHPRVSLVLLPFSAGAHEGMGTPFTILQFDSELLDDVLYLEDADKKTTSREDSKLVEAHLKRFNLLQALGSTAGDFSEHADRILQQY